jgi:predicted NUDIX family phosphoesterase
MPSTEGSGEFVITFPRTRLAELGTFQGVSFDVPRYLPAILTPGAHAWSPRPEAEVDPSRKHLLSYVLFVHDRTVLKYRRGTAGSALAARDIASIGIDVHVAITGEETTPPRYESRLEEQLRSEVHHEAALSNRVAALINDDDDPLGRFHFGVVHVVRLESPAVSAGTKAMSDAKFVPIDSLRPADPRLERWSAFCLDQIERFL